MIKTKLNMITISSLCKSFIDGDGLKPILDSLNLSIEQGKSAAITGESGSGKSTLLHLIAGLDIPDSGTITVNDQDISQYSQHQADQYRKQHIGLIYQRFNLIECLSVWDNVCLPAKLNRNLDKHYIEHLLIQLGISKLMHKYPHTLSGGEQQRVAIARALAHKPRVVLADEPTGNLDDKNSENVSQLLFKLCQQTQVTLVLVTHSMSLADRAERHYRLQNGVLQLQGR